MKIILPLNLIIVFLFFGKTYSYGQSAIENRAKEDSIYNASHEGTLIASDTLSFGKSFFLTLGQNANIGDLKINFTESMNVMGAHSGNGTSTASNSYVKYCLTLSEKKEQNTLTFLSSNFNTKGEQSIKWKDYEITVLYADMKTVYLIVYKKLNKSN